MCRTARTHASKGIHRPSHASARKRVQARTYGHERARTDERMVRKSGSRAALTAAAGSGRRGWAGWSRSTSTSRRCRRTGPWCLCWGRWRTARWRRATWTRCGEARPAADARRRGDAAPQRRYGYQDTGISRRLYQQAAVDARSREAVTPGRRRGAGRCTDPSSRLRVMI